MSFDSKFVSNWAGYVANKLELVPQYEGGYRLSYGRERISERFDLPEKPGDASARYRALSVQIEKFMGFS